MTASATPAPSVAQEVDTALNFAAGFLPEIIAGLSIFPQTAAFAPILGALSPVFSAVVNAANTVAADTGKPWQQVLDDVLNHLTPGAPAAPALSPDAAPVPLLASPVQ
jgi:hypothetical protein